MTATTVALIEKFQARYRRFENVEGVKPLKTRVIDRGEETSGFCGNDGTWELKGDRRLAVCSFLAQLRPQDVIAVTDLPGRTVVYYRRYDALPKEP